jgi:hypothetical protein
VRCAFLQEDAKIQFELEVKYKAVIKFAQHLSVETYNTTFHQILSVVLDMKHAYMDRERERGQHYAFNSTTLFETVIIKAKAKCRLP